MFSGDGHEMWNEVTVATLRKIMSAIGIETERKKIIIANESRLQLKSGNFTRVEWNRILVWVVICIVMYPGRNVLFRGTRANNTGRKSKLRYVLIFNRTVIPKIHNLNSHFMERQIRQPMIPTSQSCRHAALIDSSRVASRESWPRTKIILAWPLLSAVGG